MASETSKTPTKEEILAALHKMEKIPQPREKFTYESRWRQLFRGSISIVEASESERGDE